MILEQWATEWGIGAVELRDLRRRIGAATPDGVARLSTTPKSEARVSQDVHIAASKAGVRLFRNNVGAAVDHTGRPVRYGLANTSAAMNAKLKSSDYIGLTPVSITEQHVGRVLGIFTAIECKRGGWAFSGSERELAQLRFIELVLSMGGIAAFISSVDQLPFKAND